MNTIKNRCTARWTSHRYFWFVFAMMLALPCQSQIFFVPFVKFKLSSSVCNVSSSSQMNSTLDWEGDDNLTQVSSLLPFTSTSCTEKYLYDLLKPNSPYFFLIGMVAGCFFLALYYERSSRKKLFHFFSQLMLMFGIVSCIADEVIIYCISRFCMGASSIIVYIIIFIEVVEKFDWKPSEQPRYKERLFAGILFGFSWVISRLSVVFLVLVCKHKSDIFGWYTLVYGLLYFYKGRAFIAKTDISTEQIDALSFPKALLRFPMMTLNMLILSLAWFMVGHNFYGIVLNWNQISMTGQVFVNHLIAAGFASGSEFLALMLCAAAKQKLLPLVSLQLFSGILVLVMLAFKDNHIVLLVLDGGKAELPSGIVITAHVLNVFLAATYCILWIHTIEVFPYAYRVQSLAAINGLTRIGMLLGAVFADMKLLHLATSGPAVAGSLAVFSALFLTIIPDLTKHCMPLKQKDIEKIQFRHIHQAAVQQPEAAQSPPE